MQVIRRAADEAGRADFRVGIAAARCLPCRERRVAGAVPDPWRRVHRSCKYVVVGGPGRGGVVQGDVIGAVGSQDVVLDDERLRHVGLPRPELDDGILCANERVVLKEAKKK